MTPIKCLAVKQALMIYAEGGMSPCCMISNSDYNNFSFVDAESVRKYQSSERVNRLQSDMSAGIKPVDCHKCFNKEQIREENYKSYRLYINETLENKTSENIEFLDLSLGNTCNSDCAMCKSTNSSKIESRIDRDKKLKIFPQDLYDDINLVKQSDKWFNRPEFFEWVKAQAPNLKIIKFRGGEPFLVKKLEEWIDYLIDNNYAKNITLHFNSNASILDQELMFRCIKNFKYTVVAASADGVNDCFNYIRHGLDWKEIEQNLLAMQKYVTAFENKFWVTLLCVVQTYNLNYLVELIDWSEKYRFPLDWIFLTMPEQLHIKHIKDKTHIHKVIAELTLRQQQTTFQQDVINELIVYLNSCLETTSYPADNLVRYTNYMNSFRTLQFNTETLKLEV
jgi:organic radical activating enzyme